MTTPQITPYGSWKSPITSDLIVAGTIGIGQIAIEGETIYWLEMRPVEGGRNVLVQRTATGEIRDVTPAPWNVRTRVHEYGGGAYLVQNGRVYFSNFADQCLYEQTATAEPTALTPAGPYRYADGVLDRQRQRLICVREDHSAAPQEVVNTLVSIPLQPGGEIQVLASGQDFYASPRLSPDGSRLAWISWNHPNMPWDGTELWVGQVEANGLSTQAERVAGGREESICQPEWSPDGLLYFISDRTNWWNLYRWQSGKAEPLCDLAAEFGEPHWVFRQTTYGFISADRLLCTYQQQGTHYLASLDLTTRQLQEIPTPYTAIASLQVTAEQAVFLAGSPTESSSLVRLNLARGDIEVLRRSNELAIDPGYLSVPRAIEFPTENGLTAHAFFYPPQNQDYQAPPGEKPPLLVKSHGGPTSSTSTTFNLSTQYWTSRGIAVLDVNYGGSTGYGRAYRQRLQDQWGIVDVDDCANGARYLSDRSVVDGERLMIKGGSAGGYTTLRALTCRNVFKAGASYYGVSDLEALAQDTHKFEARYLDGLIGPYPERRDLYQARSPIYATDQLACPVIFFQGLEDKIVPPNQTEKMVAALEAKGLPVAYVPFEGEQHGFRRSENIKRSLDGELYFYSRVFGFELADAVEPIVIQNL